MKLLFVDTETTGLNPYEHSIIEVAGIVAEWKDERLEILGHYQSLIQPEKEVSEYIQRLTGLTNEILVNAPSRAKIKEEWATWLSSFGDLFIIIGHSIDFDISFFKHERWYAPYSRSIDTLFLSKLFCPDSEAVNLEYLANTYKLDPNSLFAHGEAIDLSPHRALFDTALALQLYEFIIDRVYSQSWPVELIPCIEKIDLAVDKELYPKKSLILEAQAKQPLKLLWTGERTKPKIVDWLLAIEPEQWFEHLPEYINLLPSIESLLVQYSIAGLWGWQGHKTHIHFGIGSSQLATFVLKSFIDIADWPMSEPLFEDISEQIGRIKKNDWQFFFRTRLALALQESLGIDNNFARNLQKLSNEYDFIAFQCHSRDIRNELVINLASYDHHQEWLVKKLKDVQKLLQIILEDSAWPQGKLWDSIKTEFQVWLEDIETSNGFIRIRVNSYISISSEKQVNIREHIESLITTFEQPIPTRLSSEYSSALETLIGFGPLFTQYLRQLPLVEYIVDQEQSDLVQYLLPPTSGVKLVFSGQNSDLNECLKAITDTLNHKHILVLGEIASTRKIISKLLSGFQGTVVVRSSDARLIAEYQKRLNIVEIIHLHQPFWAIDSYWYQASKQSSDPEEFIRVLKGIHTHAELLKINDMYNTSLTYIREYSV
jgi:DNA polymerase III epsilon subunit-like protein